MRVNSRLTVAATVGDTDAGEGLSIFFSQNGDSQARYRFLVKAKTDQGVFDMGEFYSSPPLATGLPGRLTRMLAAAVCPGAIGWTVEVSGMLVDGEIIDDTADVILCSSRCCTAPVGVTRVGERYKYNSGDNTGITSNFLVLPGMKVTGITALGVTGGGTVVISSGDIIQVPDSISVNLAPEAIISPNTNIELNNVIWVVEYLESA
jgi:hypothetical protein